ncbi:signal recognition particle-docking protein FtsY [bacterium]|nr:signal recognition particle-docking protein FtsY [bacterium]
MLKWFRKIMGEEPGNTEAEAEPIAQPGEKPNAEFEPLDPTLTDVTGDAVDPVLSPQFIEKEEAPLAGFPNNEPIPPNMPQLEIDEDAETVAEPFDSEDQMIDVEEVAPAEPSTQPEAEVPQGFFARLKARLSKTTDTLVMAVRDAINLHPKVDEELLEQIEEILLQSDVGVATTQKIVNEMRLAARRNNLQSSDEVVRLFKNAIAEILGTENRPMDVSSVKPTIVLFVGVNGTGKTTTIGKIAREESAKGRDVMLVAADTFRAAASQQLAIWAKRTGSAIVAQKEGADPAAVVFEALEEAHRGPTPDLVLIDTAGRLHTKVGLMEQLAKIVRVVKKHYPDAPQETVLVLDATTGQNAINQVKIFNEVCQLSGLIMTKLDGTAKGGILIACKDLYKLPIFKIGIGEGAHDLRDFDPRQFVDALFGNGNHES